MIHSFLQISLVKRLGILIFSILLAYREVESDDSTNVMEKRYGIASDQPINQGNYTCWWKI